MLEEREPSIFPHPMSAWWIPILLTFGWGALFLVDIFHLDGPGEDGWTLAIGNGIAIPCTLAAVISIVVQVFRLLMYFINRPKPVSK
jgi:hypothetical protein